MVKQSFDELEVTPLFNERHPAGGPPVKILVERIMNSKALFAFFTFNSITGATRDWIIFELGAAQAFGKPIFAWVQKAVGMWARTGYRNFWSNSQFTDRSKFIETKAQSSWSRTCDKP